MDNALYVWTQADSLVEPGELLPHRRPEPDFPVRQDGRLLRTYYIYAGGKDRPVPFRGMRDARG